MDVMGSRTSDELTATVLQRKHQISKEVAVRQTQADAVEAHFNELGRQMENNSKHGSLTFFLLPQAQIPATTAVIVQPM